MKWTVEKRSVRDLLPADYNPRTLSQKEREDLEASIREFGQVVPIVVNTGKRNNTLIGGHQRVTIYADLGIEEVDVMVPEKPLTLAEEKRLNLRLNKNTGSWDPFKLKDMGFDLLTGVGFESDYLQNLYAEETHEDNFDVQKALKETKVPITKTGDLWKLGDHRLLVGDSTDQAQVARLVDKQVCVDMVYCDPPYNIGLDYTKGIGQKANYGGSYSSKKDSKTDIAYQSFVEATIGNALAYTKKDAHVFYWCDEKYIWIMQNIFQQHNIENKRVCLWIKNSANPTPAIAFNKVYEPCVYGTRGRPYLNNQVRNVTEVLNKELGGGYGVAGRDTGPHYSLGGQARFHRRLRTSDTETSHSERKADEAMHRTWTRSPRPVRRIGKHPDCGATTRQKGIPMRTRPHIRNSDHQTVRKTYWH